MESEFDYSLSHDIDKILCSSNTAGLEVILPKTPAAQASLHEYQGLLGTRCRVCLGLPLFLFIYVI